MPKQRHEQFCRSIGRARDLVGLGQSIGGMTLGRVDASDLYRASVVQAVAAVDSYVHGIVLDRAVDILLGRYQCLLQSNKIGLHFGAVADLVNAQSDAERELFARQHIAQRLSTETFQRPDDIAKALAMVDCPKVWSGAFANAELAKTTLGTVVHRRNLIVHSCDVDPLSTGNVTRLVDSDALAAIKAAEETVRGIDGYFDRQGN